MPYTTQLHIIQTWLRRRKQGALILTNQSTQLISSSTSSWKQTVVTTTTSDSYISLCDSTFESNNVNMPQNPCEQIRCSVILRASGGRLGNRMFMYASAYSLARTHNCRLYVNDSIIQELSENFQMKKIDERMWLSEEGYKSLNDVQRKLSFCEFIPDLMRRDAFKHIEIVGYWQSYLYFDAYREEIREIFSANPTVLANVIKYIGTLTKLTCPSCPPLKVATQKELRQRFQTQYNTTWIGIHIRRRDFRQLGYASDDAYIHNAMTYFRRRYYYQKIRFLIASDEKPYYQHMFSKDIKLKKVFLLPRKFTPADDLTALTLCHHSIVTGGTYSFWSAYLTGGEVIHDIKYRITCRPSDYYPPWFVLVGTPIGKPSK
ncbi:unnamed protein product [Adineta ricciae]|uniref:L-Fucosyltransferase n=1 Tax=Adineta ricciae TaxID=249248 RepID=A0A813N9R9_ADIRI|nr:unnamed protein product [Adineta ricciae]CAF0946665.1 unnamed protein product [Adineta ricciae]